MMAKLLSPIFENSKIQPLSAEEILDSKTFERFFEMVAKLLGVPVRLMLPTGEISMKHKDETKKLLFCDVIRKNKTTDEKCRTCDRFHAQKASSEKKSLAYLCHAGLTDIIVPIFDQGQLVGSLVTGRQLPSAPNEKSFESFYKRFAHPSFTKQELLEAYQKTPVADATKITSVQALLEFFAEHLMSIRSELKRPDEHNEIAQACEWMSRHFGENIYLRDICQKIGWSETYFSKRFKKIKGLSFTEYLTRIRVEAAEKLLRRSNLSVLAISATCGFQSISHFHRSFKKNKGVAPKQLTRPNTRQV